MRTYSAATLLVAAALLLAGTAAARQNILRNGSLEAGQGAGAIDPRVPENWTRFGLNVERSATVNLAPPGTGHALKAFGDLDSTSAGASQEVTNVTPGQLVSAQVSLHTPSFDKLGGSGEAGLMLEFLNLFGGTIGTQHATYVLNAGSPSDTWIPATLGPLVAPSGTTKVRLTCRLRWSGPVSGAAYWDEAILTVDGDATRLLNGDFEIAGVGTGQSPSGIDEWTGFNDQEQSDDVARHGDKSLQLGVREAYSGLYQNTTQAAGGGDHLLLRAWVWNPAANSLTAASRAGIKLEWRANGTAPPPVENLAFDETAPVESWTPVDLEVEVPPDATLARVVCIFAGDQQSTGAVYFDSAWAERSSQPGVNLLLNSSFEDGFGGNNGLDYWTEFGGGGATTQKDCFGPALDNICSARGTGPQVTGIWQEVPVAAGETLTMRVWVYSSSFEPLTGPARAGIKVEWRLGTLPPLVDIGGPDNTISAGAPTDTWIPLTIDYVVPPGANAFPRFVTLIEKATGLTGRVYFDACELVILNRFDGCDVDGDDDQDLHDFAWMQQCFTDVGPVPLPFNGLTFDSDDDSDVDMQDFLFFAPRMTGPAQ